MSRIAVSADRSAATSPPTAKTTKSRLASSSAPKPLIGRFAPSPSGRMHLGNLFMALLGWLIVRASDGIIVLRIEDLDARRSKPAFSDQIQRDFEALGLLWDRGPIFQSQRTAAYEEAFDALRTRGLLYPCFCTRADIAAGRAPHGAVGPIYDGRCRRRSGLERAHALEEGRRHSWRIVVPHAAITFEDAIQGRHRQRLDRDCGDFIVRRSDGDFAYQLAVVVDDIDEGVNCIVRGCDLLASTAQQIYLRALLAGEPACQTVRYAHGPVLVNADGRRLAKRDHDASLEALLARYRSPKGVVGHIAALCGLAPVDEPTTPEALLKDFDLDAWSHSLKDRTRVLVCSEDE